MAIQTHTIKKQLIVLKVAKQDKNTVRLQHKLGSLYRQAILPLLERYFDELSTSDVAHHIEKLVINLGTVDSKTLERDFYTSFHLKAYTALLKALQGAEKITIHADATLPNQAVDKQHSQAITSDLALLKRFIETGLLLPQWYGSLKVEPVTTKLMRLIEKNPHISKQFLHTIIPVEMQLKRFIYQFPDICIYAACQLLSPIADFIINYQQELLQRMTQRSNIAARLNLSVEKLRLLVWQSILLNISVNNTKVLVERSLHYIALANSYETKRLISELTDTMVEPDMDSDNNSLTHMLRQLQQQASRLSEPIKIDSKFKKLIALFKELYARGDDIYRYDSLLDQINDGLACLNNTHVWQLAHDVLGQYSDKSAQIVKKHQLLKQLKSSIRDLKAINLSFKPDEEIASEKKDIADNSKQQNMLHVLIKMLNNLYQLPFPSTEFSQLLQQFKSRFCSYRAHLPAILGAMMKKMIDEFESLASSPAGDTKRFESISLRQTIKDMIQDLQFCHQLAPLEQQDSLIEIIDELIQLQSQATNLADFTKITPMLKTRVKHLDQQLPSIIVDRLKDALGYIANPDNFAFDPQALLYPARQKPVSSSSEDYNKQQREFLCNKITVTNDSLVSTLSVMINTINDWLAKQNQLSVSQMVQRREKINQCTNLLQLLKSMAKVELNPEKINHALLQERLKAARSIALQGKHLLTVCEDFPAKLAHQLHFISKKSDQLKKYTIELHSNELQKRSKTIDSTSKSENIIQKLIKPQTRLRKQLSYLITTLELNLRTQQHIEQASQLKKVRKQHKDPYLDVEFIPINNAGLVIFWSFLPHLFKQLKFIENDHFTNPQMAERAIGILQQLAYPDTEILEQDIVLNKVLCGIPIEASTPLELNITEEEQQTLDDLTRAVIAYWKILRDPSPEAFRQMFIQRQGQLKVKQGSWVLEMTRQPFDILLDSLPWSIGTVTNSWMQGVLYVHW